MKNNIILIGFMGVGKSTIGRLLSKKFTEYMFLDTDDLIESMYGKSIKDIFEIEGEGYFRHLEARVGKWLKNSVHNSIIASGGGFYNSCDLSQIGQVVYLKSDFDNIINRLKKECDFEQEILKRPLLQDLNRAKKLYDIRIKQYEKVAHTVINIDKLSIDDVVDRIEL